VLLPKISKRFIEPTLKTIWTFRASLLGNDPAIAEHFRTHRPDGVKLFFAAQLDKNGTVRTMLFHEDDDFTPHQGRGDEVRLVTQRMSRSCGRTVPA